VERPALGEVGARPIGLVQRSVEGGDDDGSPSSADFLDALDSRVEQLLLGQLPAA
jgi:hypothetical protein